MAIINFQAAVRLLRRETATTLSTLAPLWLADRTADNRRPRGVQNYKEVFDRFVVFAGDIDVSTVSEELIRGYKRDLMSRVDAGTARHALTVVRSFLNWCVVQEYVRVNVALRVNHPHVEPPNPDPLTREQIEQLMKLCDRPPQSHKATWRRNRRAVFLMLYAGLRLAEVAGLEWRDIDLDRGTITIRREIAKGGKPRVVPTAPELEAELRAAKRRRRDEAVVDQGDTPKGQGQALEVKSLAHVFERWVFTRGLDIHAHQLRATFATELYIAGEDIATIQRLLGHSDPKTTMRYIGASSAKERAAVLKLRFRAGTAEQTEESKKTD